MADGFFVDHPLKKYWDQHGKMDRLNDTLSAVRDMNMTPTEYNELARRTEMRDFGKLRERINADDETLRLIHAGMGMSTEIGEFQDSIKRYLFYGKPIDRTHMIEELGDILWYFTGALDALNVPMEHVARANINKLAARYPDKFDDANALVRDLEAEHRALTGAGAVGTGYRQCPSCDSVRAEKVMNKKDDGKFYCPNC